MVGTQSHKIYRQHSIIGNQNFQNLASWYQVDFVCEIGSLAEMSRQQSFYCCQISIVRINLGGKFDNC